MKKFFFKLFSTWFYLGLSSKMPGTIGTFGAIPLVFAVSFLETPATIAILVGSILFAVFVSHQYSLQIKEKDSQSIVIDEVVGFLVAMAFVDFNFILLAIGFLLFRFFDIYKPFWVGYIDKNISGGIGIVGDDIVAGVFSNALLQIIAYNFY